MDKRRKCEPDHTDDGRCYRHDRPYHECTAEAMRERCVKIAEEWGGSTTGGDDSDAISAFAFEKKYGTNDLIAAIRNTASRSK